MVLSFNRVLEYSACNLWAQDHHDAQISLKLTRKHSRWIRGLNAFTQECHTLEFTSPHFTHEAQRGAVRSHGKVMFGNKACEEFATRSNTHQALKPVYLPRLLNFQT